MAQIQKRKGLKKVPKNQIKDSSGVKGAGQVTGSSGGGGGRAPPSSRPPSSQTSAGYGGRSSGNVNSGDIRAQLSGMFGGAAAPPPPKTNNPLQLFRIMNSLFL